MSGLLCLYFSQLFYDIASILKLYGVDM